MGELPGAIQGFQAAQQEQQQRAQQQFMMLQGLMQMQGQQEDRQQRAQLFPLELKEREAKVKKMQDDAAMNAQMNAQLGPLMANGGAGVTADAARAVGMNMALHGHQGSAAWLAQAERLDQRARDQATMDSMKTQQGVTPVTSVDDDGNPMPVIQGRPGMFDALAQSQYAPIAQAARNYQQQINSGNQGMTPTQANAHMDRLTNLYTTQAGQDARLDKRQDQRIEIRNMPPAGDTSPYTNVQQDGRGGFVGLNKKTMRMEQIPGAGAAVPGSQQLTGEDYLKTLPKQDAELVRGVAEGRISPKDLSTKGGHRERILGQANQYMPGFDPVANAQISSAMTALERQRAQVMTYEKTALGGADIALEMSAKVDRTGAPILNKYINAGRKELMGDADVTRLANATETFTNEYAKVMSGSSGGQATTVSMQEHARKMLNAAMTKEQFAATIDLMKREMTQTREKAFDAQIAEMRGRMRNSGSNSARSESGPAKVAPQKGEVRNGYEYLGGDPANQMSWRVKK